MRSVLLLLAIAVAGGWAVIRHLPHSEAQVARPGVRTQEVQSVAVDGRGLPVHALRALLTTRAGDLLDGNRLEQDRIALEGELAARGYLAAVVEPADVTFGPAGGAFVTFSITQGPVFKLRSVTVTGATEREHGVLTIAAGDDAIADRIERARQNLADHLSSRGQAREVTVALRTDRAANAVDVELLTH